MENTHNACVCVGFCNRLHLDYASCRCTGLLLQPWICNVFTQAFKQLCEDYPSLCRDWALLCPSTCYNDIQLQESVEKNSGAQRSIGACPSTPRRIYDGVQARDSFKQIFVCCGFCLYVVLGTLVDHYHPNALRFHWNDATKCSTAMHFLPEFVQCY